MRTIAKWILPAYLSAAAAAFAGDPTPAKAADRYSTRCRPHGPSRINDEQGSMLSGMFSGWTDQERRRGDDRKTVLMAASLDGLVQGPAGVKSLSLQGGRLEGSPNLVGAVLQGTDSEGQPVEVAICGAEPSAKDPDTMWYRIEAWNPISQEWDNPCVPTGAVPAPRALVLSGTWDAGGARHDAPGKVTFACENGVLSKCVGWGYKPWATRNGRSLAEAHQACTRMARADYCGDGTSHTRQGNRIDYYDSLGIGARTPGAPPDWLFEAAWRPDGASCIGRTRDGRPLESVLQECPGRFKPGAADLGDGDRCVVQRADAAGSPPVLRNRSPVSKRAFSVP